MPIIKSAKKKMRQSKVRQIRNKKRKALLKEALKTFSQKKTEDAQILAQSIIDKAVKWGIIKENRAARLKSKLVKSLSQKAPKPKRKVKEIKRKPKKKS